MNRRLVLAILRIGFAVLAVVAIGVQMLDLADRGVLNPINFFSYFTIESNLIAVAALLWAATALRAGPNPRLDFFRGAATNLHDGHLRGLRVAAGGRRCRYGHRVG